MSGGSSHNKSSFHQIRIWHSLLSDEVKEVLEIVTFNSGTKNWPSKFRVRNKYAPEKNGDLSEIRWCHPTNPPLGWDQFAQISTRPYPWDIQASQPWKIS